MADVKPLKTKGVPVDYMDVQTLWNDRRDPHANPLSSSPRRENPRPNPSQLGGMVEQIFRPTVGDNFYQEQTKRLYQSGAASGGVERSDLGVGPRER